MIPSVSLSLALVVLNKLAVAAPMIAAPSGTYVGASLPSFTQEAFLGIPYASKTTRFTPSKLINGTAGSVVDATAYGASCPGYGSDTTLLVQRGLIQLDEDCLSLNVVRPAGVAADAKLPVLVWIYGGGWQQGATADPRYNMSYMLHQSALNGKPLIGVSVNYRLAGFGFLFSQQVMNSGNTNLGLRDQRVALEFVRANIDAFGGDARKVTLWGESAGAYSVGAHLLSYGGRDDGLFRAAIMDSGSAVGPPWNDTRWYQHLYDQIATDVGCFNATDSLACLRNVPYARLYPAMNVGSEFFAVIDGVFMQQWPLTATLAGAHINVPLLLGSNTDEGVSFGVQGVNTDAQAVAQLISSQRWVVTAFQAQQILKHYPNDPVVGSPYGTGNTTFPKLGAMYKRYSSIAGDLTMAASRRLNAAEWARAGNTVWSYRWDQAALNSSTTIGVGHFAEIPYVFANTAQDITPLPKDARSVALANLAARMWTSFAHDLDPNGHGVKGIVQWPNYRDGPRNIVLRVDQSYVEKDTYRADGMAYINTILR